MHDCGTLINPFLVEGMAEGGTIGAPGAIVNAIADALCGFDSRLGAAVTFYPISPARIVALIAAGSQQDQTGLQVSLSATTFQTTSAG